MEWIPLSASVFNIINGMYASLISTSERNCDLRVCVCVCVHTSVCVCVCVSQEEEGVLYVRQQRLQSVGGFSLVLLHSLAHVACGEMDSDSGPAFQRTFFKVQHGHACTHTRTQTHMHTHAHTHTP